MWVYEKKLQYPVKIKNPNAGLAKIIISQLGGPDGELGAATRYLSQRYVMPYREVVGILTDVGTEELAHVEMISAIVYQLTRNLSMDDIKASGFDSYFVDHTTGIYPVSAGGIPFSEKYVGVKGDVIADLNEDLAADGAIMGRLHYSKKRLKIKNMNIYYFLSKTETGDKFISCCHLPKDRNNANYTISCSANQPDIQVYRYVQAQ